MNIIGACRLCKRSLSIPDELQPAVVCGTCFNRHATALDVHLFVLPDMVAVPEASDEAVISKLRESIMANFGGV